MLVRKGTERLSNPFGVNPSTKVERKEIKIMVVRCIKSGKNFS